MDKENNELRKELELVRKEFEAYKKHSENEMFRLQKSFLENISHEIRSPMNTIIGFSTLLSTQNLSAQKQKKFSNMIYNSSKKLLKFLDDLIEMSKIESGLIELSKSECQLNIILNELYHSYEELRLRTGHKYVTLSLDKSYLSDGLIILSDKYKLRQIIAVLLDNALRFTSIGEVSFGYRPLENDILEFFVRDTGIGIEEENHEYIFKKFSKLNKKPETNVGGIGVGLYVGKKLAKLLGGEILVKSKPNHGSEFIFRMKAEIVNKLPKEIPDSKVDASSFNWSGKTLLIAEDEKMNYLLLKEILKPTKIKIISVQNGEHAVEICQSKRKIDIVLMDVQMPVMDGYDATRQIKFSKPDLPVIAQTAYALAGEQEKSLEAGCNDYISKPVDANKLLLKMNKFL